MRSTPLTPMDLAFTGRNSFSVEFVFSFPYAVSENRLRRALQRAAKVFYPVNGELKADAEFSMRVVARPEPPDLRVLNYSGDGPNLLSPAELADLSEEIHSLPGEKLFRAVLAHTARGSLVGIHISHCLVDGYSFFYFLSFLSSCFNDSVWNPRTWMKQTAMYPDLDRRVLCPQSANLTTSPHKDGINAQDLFDRTGLSWGGPRPAQKLSETHWEYWEFSDAEISKWLKEAAAHTDVRLSKHDVLTAHLWKRVAAEWPSRGDSLTCTNAFDYRRVHGELTPKYFGNAIRCASVAASKQEILDLPMGLVAQKVRKATAAIDEAAARRSLDCVEEIRRLHGTQVMERFHVSDPNHGLLVTNLSRVPLKAFNLGGGPPDNFVGLTPAPRSAMVLAAPGGLKVRMEAPR